MVSIFAPYRYFFHFPKRPPPPALRSFICRPFCAFGNPACNNRAPCLRGRARRAPRRFVFPPKSTKDTASCHRWREAKCISLCIESLCPVASLGWISRTPRRILLEDMRAARVHRSLAASTGFRERWCARRGLCSPRSTVGKCWAFRCASTPCTRRPGVPRARSAAPIPWPTLDFVAGYPRCTTPYQGLAPTRLVCRNTRTCRDSGRTWAHQWRRRASILVWKRNGPYVSIRAGCGEKEDLFEKGQLAK